MIDQPRPVWLTRQQIENLYWRKTGARAEILAAWDAAPTDAAEAVVTALEGCGIFSLKRREAAAVLRALGVSDAS